MLGTHVSSTTLPTQLSPSLADERTPLISPFFFLSLARREGAAAPRARSVGSRAVPALEPGRALAPTAVDLAAAEQGHAPAPVAELGSRRQGRRAQAGEGGARRPVRARGAGRRRGLAGNDGGAAYVGSCRWSGWEERKEEKINRYNITSGGWVVFISKS